MVMRCCAVGCLEATSKNCQVSFHRFPADSFYKKKWCLAIRRKNFQPGSHSRMCSKHFTDECYVLRRNGKKYIKRDAVPTLFNYENSPRYDLRVVEKQTVMKSSLSRKKKQPTKDTTNDENIQVTSIKVEPQDYISTDNELAREDQLIRLGSTNFLQFQEKNYDIEIKLTRNLGIVNNGEVATIKWQNVPVEEPFRAPSSQQRNVFCTAAIQTEEMVNVFHALIQTQLLLTKQLEALNEKIKQMETM